MNDGADTLTYDGEGRILTSMPAGGATMAVRRSTHTGRPLGIEEFVHELEELTKRPLAPRKEGRPAKPDNDPRQDELDIET